MTPEGHVDGGIAADSILIRCTLSKLVFPEMCPVCPKEPEDLVAITVIERPLGEKGDDKTYSAMERGTSKADIALETARGAATLWVPTCLRHGSESVRTDRMRLISLAGFILFYTMLYLFLSVRSSGSPFATGGLIASGGLLVLFFLYGYIPRALERSLKGVELEYSKDRVYLKARNPNYLR